MQVNSPSELKWHRLCASGSLNHVHRPCRVIWSEEAGETLIEYISSCSRDAEKRVKISTKRIIPYHGNSSPQNGWCDKIIESYGKFLLENELKGKEGNSNLIRKETKYLDNIFRMAKKNEVCSSDSSDTENDENDCLDEPYTQALGLGSDDEQYKSLEKIALAKKPKREPIRAGDVIEYFSPIFVAGDKRGRRITKVLSVDSKRDPALVLENGDFLPPDTQVKRTKEFLDGNLVTHHGIYRPIKEFKLPKSSLNDDANQGMEAGIIKESERLGKILRTNLNKFRTKAEKDGFAPLDIVHNFKCSEKTFSKEIDSNYSVTLSSDEEIPVSRRKNGSSQISLIKNNTSDTSNSDSDDFILTESNKLNKKKISFKKNERSQKMNHASHSSSPNFQTGEMLSSLISSRTENIFSDSDEDLDSRLEEIRKRRKDKNKQLEFDEKHHFSYDSRSPCSIESKNSEEKLGRRLDFIWNRSKNNRIHFSNDKFFLADKSVSSTSSKTPVLKKDAGKYKQKNNLREEVQVFESQLAKNKRYMEKRSNHNSPRETSEHDRSSSTCHLMLNEKSNIPSTSITDGKMNIKSSVKKKTGAKSITSSNFYEFSNLTPLATDYLISNKGPKSRENKFTSNRNSKMNRSLVATVFSSSDESSRDSSTSCFESPGLKKRKKKSNLLEESVKLSKFKRCIKLNSSYSSNDYIYGLSDSSECSNPSISYYDRGKKFTKSSHKLSKKPLFERDSQSQNKVEINEAVWSTPDHHKKKKIKSKVSKSSHGNIKPTRDSLFESLSEVYETEKETTSTKKMINFRPRGQGFKKSNTISLSSPESSVDLSFDLKVSKRKESNKKEFMRLDNRKTSRTGDFNAFKTLSFKRHK